MYLLELIVFTIKMYSISECWYGDMFNFDFLWKCLGLASPPPIVYYFPREIFLMFCSINWPNFIVSFSLLLEILGNMCIVIICCSVFDVINFEINHSFLIKPFFYTYLHNNQKLRTKTKHVKNEKSF